MLSFEQYCFSCTGLRLSLSMNEGYPVLISGIQPNLGLLFCQNEAFLSQESGIGFQYAEVGCILFLMF